MNKRIFIIISIFAILIIGTFCWNPSDEGEENTKTIVGTWEEIIPAFPPIIPKSLIVRIAFNNLPTDSSFLLEVLEEETTKHLFIQNGVWSIVNNTFPKDSVYLYGDECSILDTTADPDTITSLPDSVCGQTIFIDTTGSTTNQWTIKMSALAPFMAVFLSSDIINNLSTMEFFMERKVRIRDD